MTVAPIDEGATQRIIRGSDVRIGRALGHAGKAGVPVVGVGSAIAELFSKLSAVVLAAAEQEEGEGRSEDEAAH